MLATSVRPTELNEANIKGVLPGETLRDPKIRGLQLRCFVGRKSFYLYFRTKAGVERKPKLGDHGSISLAQARKIAQDMLGEVAAGKDPSSARAAARDENTMTDLWVEYWKRHGSKKKSADEDERIWTRFFEPDEARLEKDPSYKAPYRALAKAQLSSITYSALADLHEDLAATPVQANRILALLSTMFNFGIQPLEWVKKNPTEGVKRYKEVKRRRYATPEEVAKIAAELQAEADENPQSVAFLYLLILTGARKGEIAGARWNQLHETDGFCRLVLDDHKTDYDGSQRLITLPPQAMEVIRKLDRTNGTITGILDPKKLWAKIRENAGCPDLHMHDLRHSFASAALASGLSLAQVGELLGHQSTQTTKRYSHLVGEAAAAAAGLTANRIASQMGLLGGHSVDLLKGAKTTKAKHPKKQR